MQQAVFIPLDSLYPKHLPCLSFKLPLRNILQAKAVCAFGNQGTEPAGKRRCTIGSHRPVATVNPSCNESNPGKTSETAIGKSNFSDASCRNHNTSHATTASHLGVVRRLLYLCPEKNMNSDISLQQRVCSRHTKSRRTHYSTPTYA